MTGKLLLEQTFPGSVEAMLAELKAADSLPQRVRIWLFEDKPRRQWLEKELDDLGVQAHVYSAYKPLLHYFLEEVDTAGLTHVDVIYPLHPTCHEARFRLEAYPLAQLLEGISLRWQSETVETTESPLLFRYRVQLHYGDRVESKRLLAPNVIKNDFLGQPVCVPSAWVIRHDGGHTQHQAWTGAYQAGFDAIMDAVTSHEWGQDEPYFGQLRIDASFPGIERPVAVGHEHLSTAEAWHEELYFSLLEYFQHYSGREPGSRGLQPGQIVPLIQATTDKQTHIKVTVTPASAITETRRVDRLVETPAAQEQTLEKVTSALPQATVEKALATFKGEHFVYASHQGRPVHGVHIKGSHPAVLISGAQHANETSGVVGALRAASALQYDQGAHLVLMPLENPDGYAMHQALCKQNPYHMHHAARYTALGDDLEYREHPPLLAAQARQHAFKVSHAGLHLNLHGYPSHEWTRPLTGYLPRGFELWGIPKGFFLILRYRDHSEDKAHALLAYLTGQLARNQALQDYNARQLDTYRQHAQSLPFKLMHGIPYMATKVEKMACDVTLVTEFPDETIDGEDFIFAHSVQCETVEKATRWWWQQDLSI